MRGLLGRRSAVASVDLPGGREELARDLPDGERDGVVDAWIDGSTLLPFHTAFMPEQTRHAARQAMRGEVAGLYASLGLATFKVRAAERLRFCHECLVVMEAEGADLWWRRDHQLPGVSVCPVHRSVLHLSDVAPGDDRHAFVAASRAVCRRDAPPAAETLATGDLALSHDLARRAAALLTMPGPARSYEGVVEDYRMRLAEVGLMRSRRKVDHDALRAAFRDRWGNLADLIPGMELVDDEARSWLSALVRNGRRAAHPLQHLMLGAVLDGFAKAPVLRPFGNGPWVCRNPVADHHRQLVITAVETRRDRAVVYGDFACGCGYLYTRSCSAQGIVGEPKYRRFGPLLGPALEQAVARGDSLRGTARSLALDPKTLMREAAMAGVTVPWATGASGAVPAAPAAVPAVTAKKPRPRRRCAIRNWFAIDTRLARSVKSAAMAILAEQPPIRLTFATLERRVARREWVLKRRMKLPQTMAAMEGRVETTDEFRHRRLAWCVATARAAGRLGACDVLRDAGLPMSWMDNVRLAVADARIPIRKAA